MYTATLVGKDTFLTQTGARIDTKFWWIICKFAKSPLHEHKTSPKYYFLVSNATKLRCVFRTDCIVDWSSPYSLNFTTTINRNDQKLRNVPDWTKWHGELPTNSYSDWKLVHYDYGRMTDHISNIKYWMAIKFNITCKNDVMLRFVVNNDWKPATSANRASGFKMNWLPRMIYFKKSNT